MDIICHKCHVPTDETDIIWTGDNGDQCVSCYETEETKWDRKVHDGIDCEADNE
jgi:hypothetical protein